MIQKKSSMNSQDTNNTDNNKSKAMSLSKGKRTKSRRESSEVEIIQEKLLQLETKRTNLQDENESINNSLISPQKKLKQLGRLSTLVYIAISLVVILLTYALFF